MGAIVCKNINFTNSNYNLMALLQNISLKPYNTFGLEANARKFFEIHSLADLQELLYDNKFLQEPMLVLGGGSNMLFTRDYSGMVLKMNSKGIQKMHESDEEVLINVEAGELWDDFVHYCMRHRYAGVEILALIPGTVGSCPIQNIGAYGVEVKDVIESVEIIHIESLQMSELSNAACCFGYRDSIFKHSLKGKVIILSVNFCLKKKYIPLTSYGTLKQELELAGISNPSIKDMVEMVSNIRLRKLPNPNEIGNAGSFFKNPTVSKEFFEHLQGRFADMPHYPSGNDGVKLAAAWMIEQCGWKGFREGDAGVHPLQALVLVNYGNASGKEIIALARKIQQSVEEKFAVEMEMEVNVV